MSTLLPSHSVAMLACIVLFDFAAAFPSVIHKWIRMVLHAAEAPEGLINVFEAMYSKNVALMLLEGAYLVLFEIVSGFLQGCPLSGMIFNIAIDPLLWCFSKLIILPKLGFVLACADDFGATMKRLEYLRSIYRVFKMFESVKVRSYTYVN